MIEGVKKILFILALLLFPLSVLGQVGALQGTSTVGGISATTQGAQSSNKLQGVIPAAKISIYLTGTQTLATLTSDGTHSLSNPFYSNASSAVNPGGYVAFASTNIGYDVVASSGQGTPNCTTGPLCYTQPVTLCKDCYPSSQIVIPTAGCVGQNAVANGCTGASTAAGAYDNIVAPNLIKSVTAFGAVGNGSTDNTTALNTALAYALANNVCIYFPNGAYMYGTPLTWNTNKTLCLIGERSTTAYLDYNGGSTTDAFLIKNTTVGSNGYFSDINLRNIGFAANTSAANALHIYLSTGTIDTLDGAGGSANTFLFDSANFQGDVRNLRVAPGAFFPAITGATCVNGVTFAGAAGIGSGQFSLETPTIEGCSNIGLNMADAGSITVNDGQIAGNHQQLYQNCTSGCNPNGNTYNQVLFEGLGAPGACGPTGCNITISNVAVAAHVATFTAVNNFTAGTVVYLYGLENNPSLDSCSASGCAPLTVLSTGLSGTQWEANVTPTTIASNPEWGIATTYLPNQVVNGGNVFIGTNLGFIPTLVSGNYNQFDGQNIMNPYVQAGVIDTVIFNNTVARDSIDGGTGTSGFGNTLSGAAPGTASVPFNNLIAASLTVNSEAAAGQDIATFNANPLIAGNWGISLTGAGSGTIYANFGGTGTWGDTGAVTHYIGAIGGTPTARTFTPWCTFTSTSIACPQFDVGANTVIPSTATGYTGTSTGKVVLSTGTGYTGSCASTTTVTVVDGIITGCS